MFFKIDKDVREGVDRVTLYERRRIVARVFVPSGAAYLAVAEQLKLYGQTQPEPADERQLDLPHTSVDTEEAAQ
jgi:hypothetical protein